MKYIILCVIWTLSSAVVVAIGTIQVLQIQPAVQMSPFLFHVLACIMVVSGATAFGRLIAERI
jgi:hypothetical protein